jgi:hypothetical protein
MAADDVPAGSGRLRLRGRIDGPGNGGGNVRRPRREQGCGGRPTLLSLFELHLEVHDLSLQSCLGVRGGHCGGLRVGPEGGYLGLRRLPFQTSVMNGL